MANHKCNNLGTAKQIENLRILICEARKENWTPIKYLEEAQQIYGYLPKPVIEELSSCLGKTTTELYSIITFYSAFSLKPKGKYPISVCLGTACYVKDSETIYNKVCDILKITAGQCTPDGLFSIDQTRCIGCCNMAPVMSIGADVYGNVKLSEVENILKKYMGAK